MRIVVGFYTKYKTLSTDPLKQQSLYFVAYQIYRYSPCSFPALSVEVSLQPAAYLEKLSTSRSKLLRQ